MQDGYEDNSSTMIAMLTMMVVVSDTDADADASDEEACSGSQM